MQKENQRVAISKRLLKESIMKLLQTKRIDKISVSELCAEAQINRTTFYRHYQTPHDVLWEIELDFVEGCCQVPAAARGRQEVTRHIYEMCSFLYDNKEIVKLFLENNMDRDFMKLFQNFANDFLGARNVWYKGRLADEQTLRLMSSSFAAGGYAMIRQWLMEDLPKTPDEIAELIVGSFNRDVVFS